MTRRSAAIALVTSAFAPSCEILYGTDTPRRSLQGHDYFVVEPQCGDLVIDPASLAAPPRVVTLTGRRQQTGLGAESVPVSVRIGLCDPGAAPGAPAVRGTGDAGGEAGAGGEGAAGRAGNAEAAETGGSRQCPNAGEPLQGPDQARFALVAQEGRGCRARSSSRLECILDSNGEASFGVISESLNSVLTLDGYLPICVTPLELAESGKDPPTQHRVPMAFKPRFGESRIAVAVAQLPGMEPTPSIQHAEGCVLRTCTDLSPRARFQAGIVSPDIPLDAIRTSDFVPLGREAKLKVSLRTLTSPSAGAVPFLTLDESCLTRTDANGPADDEGGADDEADAGDSIDLEIASGQSDTSVFFLCGPAFSSSFEVVATLEDATGSQPLLRTNRVALPSLVERYTVDSSDGQKRLFAKSCNDEQAKAMNVRVAPPWFVFGDGEEMLLECRVDADAGAGAGGAGGAESMDDSSDCSSVTLSLSSPEGTCTVRSN